MRSLAAMPIRAGLLLLAVCSLLLFVVPAVSDRALTVHEAVLPQSARTMYYDGDFLVPKRGTAPWLENPPLPQWVTVALCHVVGTCDAIWVSRLGVALAGTALVIVTALMASTLFGDRVGLLSGFTMATSYIVIRYASLAEDEIYLALLVAIAAWFFVREEFAAPGRPHVETGGSLLLRPVSKRSLNVWLFFVALGVTNLAKGVIFGPAMVIIPAGLFVLASQDRDCVLRYLWLPGALLVVMIGSAWPLLLYQRHPDVLPLWGFDLFGRLSGSYTDINQPAWYYLRAVPEAIAPWILIAPFALWFTAKRAAFEPRSPERFLWIWAIGFPLVLTIPSGKHQHYLLHGIVPWAILSALALQRLWQRLSAGRAWRGDVAAVALFATLGLAFAYGQWRHKGTHHHDADMLKRVAAMLPADAVILADMDVVGLRGFHTLMYLPATAIPLHNLTFLQDRRITSDHAYLVTRYARHAQIDPYAEAEVLLQSEETDRRTDTDALLTLFELHFKPGMQRVDTTGVYISPMQAMHREPGPELPPPVFR